MNDHLNWRVIYGATLAWLILQVILLRWFTVAHA